MCRNAAHWSNWKEWWFSTRSSPGGKRKHHDREYTLTPALSIRWLPVRSPLFFTAVSITLPLYLLCLLCLLQCRVSTVIPIVPLCYLARVTLADELPLCRHALWVESDSAALTPNCVSTGHLQFVSLYLQLFLTVCVFFRHESDGIPWSSTLTKGSSALPLLGTGKLDPLITCGQTHTCTDAVWMYHTGGAWYQGWTDVLKQENRGLLREEKRRGEGCNYTSLERGRLICSPLTLSLLFPDSDQRQTCMYLSRHAPLGTDGALQCPAWNYSAFSSAEVKLQSTLPCVVLIHSHNGPFLWVCRYQPGVIIPQRFAIEKDRPLLIVDSFMLNRLGKLKGKCCFSWTDE